MLQASRLQAASYRFARPKPSRPIRGNRKPAWYRPAESRISRQKQSWQYHTSLCGCAGRASALWFTLKHGMRLTHVLFAPALAAIVVSSALAQDSNSKPAQQEIPDAPQATAAAMVHPNGPSVVMDTSMGRITCQFFQKQAPNAVANFIGLAEGTKDWTEPGTNKKMHHKPLYDGTTFHRVI